MQYITQAAAAPQVSYVTQVQTQQVLSTVVSQQYLTVTATVTRTSVQQVQVPVVQTSVQTQVQQNYVTVTQTVGGQCGAASTGGGAVLGAAGSFGGVGISTGFNQGSSFAANNAIGSSYARPPVAPAPVPQGSFGRPVKMKGYY